MTSPNRYIIELLREMRYINRGFIFFADLFVSSIGTLLSFVYIITLNHGWQIRGSILSIMAFSVLISSLLFLLSGLYRTIIRHSSLKDLTTIFYLLIVKNGVLAIVAAYLTGEMDKWIVAAVILDLLITTFLMIGFRSLIVNLYYSIVKNGRSNAKNAFMYSTMDNSPALAEQISKDLESPYYIRGFLTTNLNKTNTKIGGKNVFYIDPENKKFKLMVKRHEIEYLIFSSKKHFERERGGLVEHCINNGVRICVAGAMKTANAKGKIAHELKAINIEDLLERNEIMIDTQAVSDEVKGKCVLVTGAAGSIGGEIVMQLIRFEVKQLILFDSAETPLHNLQLELQEKAKEKAIVYVLGDVRSAERVEAVCQRYRPEMAFHAAAYKHVPMIEANPCESIMTNVVGTINVARSAQRVGVTKFVMISTDKAVNPTNVMGASKRIAEMCVQSIATEGTTRFVTTRFGNVLVSNGSVIPRFTKQIADGGPVTVTHPDIERFFMTIPEACRLVLQAASMGEGGELFLFDMGEKIRIVDLARKMILLSGLKPDEDIKIVFSGLRPGEKLYEEDLSVEEQTSMTNHHKIKISKARHIDKAQLDDNVVQLIEHAKRIDIEQTVRLMKKIVPEYISNNSEFSNYDSTNEQ